MSDQTPNTMDLREALRNASQKLAAALNDLQALQVETRWVELKNNAFDEKEARLVASTRIELDGDTSVVLPMRDENGSLTPDQALLDLHKESVASAVEYRTMLLKMITDFVRQTRTR
jgi:hypothetical protein